MARISEHIAVVIRKEKYPYRLYKCKICGREYFSLNGARVHVKKKHKEKIEAI
jgi:hypothetical protein